MLNKPSWQQIHQLPKFDSRKRLRNHDRIIYFNSYIPESVFKHNPLYMQVLGTQMHNGYPPRPHHWYIAAYDRSSVEALAYEWHDDVQKGTWLTIDLEEIMSLKFGRWHVRNDRTWRPRQLSQAKITNQHGGSHETQT